MAIRESKVALAGSCEEQNNIKHGFWYRLFHRKNKIVQKQECECGHNHSHIVVTENKISQPIFRTEKEVQIKFAPADEKNIEPTAAIVSEVDEASTNQIDKDLLHLIKGVHSQQRDLMDIKEFEGLCLSSGFMSLDAAVEIANEYGYDNFDEPLFDLAPEENCVYITEDLLTRICSRHS